MQLNEVKITEAQFNHLESIRYDLPQKYLYASKILNPRYKITKETTFVTYKDKWNYYLVFECEVEPSKKLNISIVKENDDEFHGRLDSGDEQS